MKTILVTGANSQLAKCIKDLERYNTNYSFVFANTSELNITDFLNVSTFFKSHNFDWCINCAAYTAVDLAESEKDKAFKVNAEGVKNIAIHCKKHNTQLIHISSDFVFDGFESKSYKEEHTTNPLNVYGKSKLKGEEEIISNLKTYYILRTSWLYSEYGSNFLKTMLRLGDEKKEINVVEDQIGTPTYAKDLAQLIESIINFDNSQYGIYHYSNEGVASWYDFAKAIFDINNNTIKVNPIPSINYPTPAQRPSFSVLNKTKVKEAFNVEIPHWRDSLAIAISNIK
jgi:dTDP-4-dehydrorhamnose reductase